MRDQGWVFASTRCLRRRGSQRRHGRPLGRPPYHLLQGARAQQEPPTSARRRATMPSLPILARMPL